MPFADRFGRPDDFAGEAATGDLVVDSALLTATDGDGLDGDGGFAVALVDFGDFKVFFTKADKVAFFKIYLSLSTHFRSLIIYLCIYRNLYGCQLVFSLDFTR